MNTAINPQPRSQDLSSSRPRGGERGDSPFSRSLFRSLGAKTLKRHLNALRPICRDQFSASINHNLSISNSDILMKLSAMSESFSHNGEILCLKNSIQNQEDPCVNSSRSKTPVPIPIPQSTGVCHKEGRLLKVRNSQRITPLAIVNKRSLYENLDPLPPLHPAQFHGVADHIAIQSDCLMVAEGNGTFYHAPTN